MKGLLLKEWYSIIGMSNFKVLLIFALSALILGMTDTMSFMLIFLPFLAGMLPRTVLMYDENSKWSQFSLAMPYSRRAIVSAKYLATLILCTACAVFSAAVYTVSALVKGILSTEYLMMILLAGIAGGILIPAFALPIDLKYGTAKGKVFSLIYAGLFACGSGALMDLQKLDMTALTVKAAALMKSLPLAGAAAALLLFAASWMLAVRFYEKREF